VRFLSRHFPTDHLAFISLLVYFVFAFFGGEEIRRKKKILKMIKIIPAILAKSYSEFESMVLKIEPYVDLVHLDIADGKFVPNKTIDGYEEIQRIKTNLQFEIHLMIEKPEEIIENWLKTRAIRFLIHIESTKKFKNLIGEIRKSRKEIGGVLNPKTDYIEIEPYLDEINLVQFMTVDPGFYGSPFLPDVLEKIKDFHRQYPNKLIQVDGGINPETIKLVELVGATRAAVGSFIFKSSNLKEALENLLSSNGKL